MTMDASFPVEIPAWRWRDNQHGALLHAFAHLACARRHVARDGIEIEDLMSDLPRWSMSEQITAHIAVDLYSPGVVAEWGLPPFGFGAAACKLDSRQFRVVMDAVLIARGVLEATPHGPIQAARSAR